MSELSPVISQQMLDAQIAVIGSMLIDESCVAAVLSRVRDDDFTDPHCKALFQAVGHLFSQGGAVDAVTVNGCLGGEYGKIILDIMDRTPTAANCNAYIDLLRKSATLCRLQNIGAQLAEAKDTEEAQSLVDFANKLFIGRQGIKTMTMEEGFGNFFDRHNGTEKPDLLDWGMGELNSRIFVERGDMVIIGGYPSDGKTALALALAMHIARSKRVGFYSFEGSREKLHDRIVSAQALLDMSKIKKNDLSDADFDTLVSLQEKLTSPKLTLIEAAKMSVSDIQSHARAHHYDVVFVDYLQKISAPENRRNYSEFERVTDISSGLQQFGRSTGTVVVALSQLTRPEKKKDGTVPAPTMQSLRQSGQIEQDADVVLLLYSENPGDKDSLRVLKIGKNKEGERNEAFRVKFDGAHQTFGALSARSEPYTPPRREPPQRNLFAELSGDLPTPWDKEDK